MNNRPKPVVLAILDGWGVAPLSDGNALARANTPALRNLILNYPAVTLTASSAEVGLMWGEMGNSEVGHLNIGAGRIYYQSLPRINKSIAEGDFFNNPAFKQAIEHVRNNGSALHLLGLVSQGGVHSHQEHLYALLELAAREKLDKVFVHVILDGRDTIYNTGALFVKQLLEKMAALKVGKIATVSGRHWAMDRDNRWDRTQQVYNAIVFGKSEATSSEPLKAIETSYAKEVYDQQFPATVIEEGGAPLRTIADGDAVIFFNFRPDRARQLAQAFVLPQFDKFPRVNLDNLFFVTMMEYEKDLPVIVAFSPEIITTCLAKVISSSGLKQLHIAETEKYAHVTFFLNGTVEDPFPNEDRVIIPSPRVSSYDQAPAMSTPEIAKRVIKATAEEKYDFIVLNLANADMVGHTGNIDATVASAEAIDKAMGEMAEAILSKNGALLITADHGNGEEIINLQTGAMDTEHSTNPVPFIVVGKEWEGQVDPMVAETGGDLSLLQPVGVLADVAPTILKILNIEQPADMTGKALI